MRGDQLSRQWRILRYIEGSNYGLTVAEVAELEEISLRTAYRDIEALEQAGFPLYYEKAEGVNRWAFVDTYKFQVPQPFTLTDIRKRSETADGGVNLMIFQSATQYVEATADPFGLAAYWAEEILSSAAIE